MREMSDVATGDVVGLSIILISCVFFFKYAIQAIKHKFCNLDDALGCLYFALLANIGSAITILL